MQYARLGRTGLKVSRLCLGTMNIGPFSPEPESFAMMDHALDLGINICPGPGAAPEAYAW